MPSATERRTAEAPRQKTALAATLFAVAMTFIDPTAVVPAAPDIVDEPHLPASCIRWAGAARPLALGGRPTDLPGARRVAVGCADALGPGFPSAVSLPGGRVTTDAGRSDRSPV
ncbi:hypothetical protein [Streptomyces sp. BK239]|uniref:hypothetical protein n=1 Tax=Streptomyces sp. BK239 TaxID=2512155 RepID=UPI00102C11F3|nr:hypothetical protein [Streptomyces sp. BK239]RZU21865.1 hypothetical protein EV567_2373 [Streptomyces sp. BK239]